MYGFGASANSRAAREIIRLEEKVEKGDPLSHAELETLQLHYVIRKEHVRQIDATHVKVLQATLRNPLPGVDPLLCPDR